MGTLDLKYKASDNGFCRVYYTAPSKDGKRRLLYCIQNDGRQGMTLYTCSKEGEPDFPLGAQNIRSIDLPEGNDQIDREVAAFIKRLPQLRRPADILIDGINARLLGRRDDPDLESWGELRNTMQDISIQVALYIARRNSNS